jgi:hypothetical protein
MKIEKDFEFDQKKVTTLAWQSTIDEIGEEFPLFADGRRETVTDRKARENWISYNEN